MSELLPTQAAIECIRDHQERNKLVLGVDGFRAVPGGYEASLDLILDLSIKPRSTGEAAAKAEAFVRAHAADDVTFEIVAKE